MGKNGYNGKFYAVYILSRLFKKATNSLSHCVTKNVQQWELFKLSGICFPPQSQ